jgi:hypothetical protein
MIPWSASALESELAYAKVVSQKINTLDGTINGTVKLYANDTLEIKTALSFTLPNGWTGSYTLPNNVQGYVLVMSGDSLAIPFILQYPTANLPFYPQEFALQIPLYEYHSSGGTAQAFALLPQPDETRKAIGKVYFTPYNTVELWSVEDFENTYRSWIDPSNNPLAQRIYVAEADIPVSDLNLAIDTLNGQDQEDVETQEIFVTGLAYSIPMKIDYAAIPEGWEDDGPDSTYTEDPCEGCPIEQQRLFGRTFSGTVTGRPTSRIVNDVGVTVDIPLSGVFIKLKEDDRFIDEDFGTTHTDANGNFTFTYSKSQSFAEGRQIELYLKIKSKNTNYNLRVSKNSGLYSGVYEQTLSLGSHGTNAGIINATMRTDIRAMRANNWMCRAWRYVENVGGYDLINGLTVNPHSGNGSKFVLDGLFGISSTFSNPHIKLTGEDCDHENTAYHEFGHFVMWNLQNKNFILVHGNPDTRDHSHGWWQENPPKLAWAEGWADAFQMIMDAAHWWEDGEYGFDELNDDETYEDRFSYSAINNGIFSEYYMACAIYDLWDGFDTTIPVSFINGNGNTVTVGHNDALSTSGTNWNDNISFSFRDILTPLVQRSGSSNKMTSIEEYFYQFRDYVIPANNCTAKANLARVFRENRVVVTSGLFDTDPASFATALSGDIIHVPFTVYYAAWLPVLGIQNESQTYRMNPTQAYFRGSAVYDLNPNIGVSSYINENLTANGLSTVANSRWRFRASGGAHSITTCENPRLLFTYTNLELGVGTGEEVRLEASGTSLFQFNTGARLVLNGNSKLTVKSGATLHIRSGAFLDLNDTAQIVVEAGGYICIEAGATLNIALGAGIVRLAGANLGVNPTLGISSTACTTPPAPNFSEALSFDGSNDYVNLPNTSGGLNHGTGNFTWEAYVRLNPSSRTEIITSKRVTSADGYIFGVWSTGKPYVQLAGTPNILPVTSSTINLYDGNCHHVAVRRSGSTISFFIDGQLLGNGNYTRSASINSTGGVRLGNDALQTGVALSGWVGEVRIWNTARTNAQISASYAANPTPLPQAGLVSYYDMKDAVNSQSLTDLASNAIANHGTLGSGTGTDTQDPAWLLTSQLTCSVAGNNFRTTGNGNEQGQDSTQIRREAYMQADPIRPAQIMVAPNPSADDFVLYLSEGFTEAVKVEIIGLRGEIVESYSLTKGTPWLRIGKRLVAGAYLLRVYDSQYIETIRLIKQ